MSQTDQMTTQFDWSAVKLRSGKHDPPRDLTDPTKVEACVMEAVFLRYAQREGWAVDKIVKGWTDHPSCVCPSITSMLISLNDRMGGSAEADERRTRVLGPLLEVVIGTKSTKAVERRRVWMSSDWSIRVAVPRLFRLTSLAPWADKLEALPEITSEKGLSAARSLLWEARQAAWAYRSSVWAGLRRKIDAVAAVAAVAAAADAVAAAADAVAADAAAAVAAAADAAVAVVAADAAAAADAPSIYAPIVAAARKARAAGGDYGVCYRAARKVADEVMATRAHRPFVALRDELDAEFVALVRRMIAVTP